MLSFDLNLLKVLDALDATRSVSRAAENLGMSQSGFSSALARLRKQLDDELFVRGAGQMQPTPRAVELIETARAALSQVERSILARADFDPLTTEARFDLAMMDVAELIIMPDLMRYLAINAPRTVVRISAPADGSLPEKLANGEVDIALGYFPHLERDAYFRQLLVSHTYACIARADHPALKNGLTREAYEALGHAVAMLPTRSNALLIEEIARQGIRQRAALMSPNHLALAETVAKTDLIATMPIAAAQHFSQQHSVTVFPLPFPSPRVPIFQYWHRRTQQDPPYRWLRAGIKTLVNRESRTFERAMADDIKHIS